MYKKMLLTIAGCLLFAGCGGGGGSSASVPPAYVGSTAQATVTTTNAKALSEDAYAGSQVSAAPISGAAKGAADGNSQPPLLQGVASILHSNVATIIGNRTSAAKVAAAATQGTVNGYSGSASYSYDVVAGTRHGTVTFSHYMADSTSDTLSGTINFSGPVMLYSTSSDAGSLDPFSVTMTNLTVTSGTESFTLTGSMNSSISFTNNIMTQTLTMSVVLTDNVSNRTYWCKDYAMAFSDNGIMTVSGTYYDPAYGYVDISTVTPLAVTRIDATPTSGRLLFTGSNGTKARLTFTSGGYTVDADTTGTGTFVPVL